MGKDATILEWKGLIPYLVDKIYKYAPQIRNF